MRTHLHDLTENNIEELLLYSPGENINLHPTNIISIRCLSTGVRMDPHMDPRVDPEQNSYISNNRYCDRTAQVHER